MPYEWDNKKPTAQMLGRWQPFHDGHYILFEEIIKKTGQVCIQIRDVQGVGYKIEKVVLPEKIQQISASKIRDKMRKDGKLK